MKNKVLSKTILLDQPEKVIKDLLRSHSVSILKEEAVKEYLKETEYPYENFQLDICLKADNRVELIPDILIDSRKLIKSFMNFREDLTNEYRVFEDEKCLWNWTECDKRFGRIKGWKYLHTANTYNWDNHYFLGTVFQYSLFNDEYDDEIVIIRWHIGVDVRVGYNLPEVYTGDFNGFIAEQESELLGYERIEHFFDEDFDVVEEIINEYIQQFLAG